jgi:hypothetical protein
MYTQSDRRVEIFESFKTKSLDHNGIPHRFRRSRRAGLSLHRLYPDGTGVPPTPSSERQCCRLRVTMEISSTSVFLLQRAPESLIRVSGQVLLGGFHLDGKCVTQDLVSYLRLIQLEAPDSRSIAASTSETPAGIPAARPT